MRGGAGASMFSKSNNKTSATELSIVSGIIKVDGIEIKMSTKEDIIQPILTILFESRKTLTSFTISDTNILDQGIVSIIGALFKNTKLSILKLSKLSSLSRFEYVNHSSFDERSIKAIIELLNFNDTLTLLDISGNSFFELGLTHILEALKNNTTITSLNISNCSNVNRESEIQALISILTENTTLTSLDISNNKIGDNILSTYFKNVLKNSNLTSLDISRNKFEFDGAVTLSEELETNNTLVSLNISDNTFLSFDNSSLKKGIDLILKSICKSQTLTELDISGFTFDEDTIENVIQLLNNQEPIRLKKLTMSNSQFLGRSAQKLFFTLERVNKTLETLDISNFRVKTYSHRYDYDNEIYNGLVSLVRVNNTLTTLNISNININSKMESLLISLKMNKTLTSLDISNNSFFDSKDVKALEELLKSNTTLKSVDIRKNNLSFSVENRLRNDLALFLSRIITNNKTLTKFYFADYTLLTDNLPIIIQALKTNNTIIDLDMSLSSNEEINSILNANKKMKEENDRKKKEENNRKKKEKDKLIKQLKDNEPSITSLDISNSNELKELIDAIKVNTKLTTININIDDIDEKTFRDVVDIVKANTKITKLTFTVRNIMNVEQKTFQDLYEALQTNTTQRDIVFSENIELAVNKYKPISKDTILASDGDINYTVNDLIVALSKKKTSEPEVRGAACMAVHNYFKALNDIKLAFKIIQLKINWEQNYRQLTLSKEQTEIEFTEYLNDLLKNSELISRLANDAKRRIYVINHIWNTLSSLIDAQRQWFGFANIPDIYSLLILIMNFMKTLPMNIQIRWCEFGVTNYIGYNSDSNSDIINSNQSLDGKESCPMGALEKFIVGIQTSLIYYMNLNNSNNNNDNILMSKISREFTEKFSSTEHNSKLFYSNTNKTNNTQKYKNFVSDRTRLFKIFLKSKEEFKDLTDIKLDEFISKIDFFDYKDPEDE